MEKQEIIGKLKEMLADGEINAYNMMNDWDPDTQEVDFDITLVLEEDDGDGNQARAVVKIERPDGEPFYMRILGTYSSWDSTEWYSDTLEEVDRAHVTIEQFISADRSEDNDFIRVERIVQ